MHARLTMLVGAFLAAAGLAAASLVGSSCRNQPASDRSDLEPGPAAEPYEYSAVVVRSMDDGALRELNVTRVARSGDKRREEWSEGGRDRVLIWRSDLGKWFLLDVGSKLFVESATQPSGEPLGDVEYVERALGDLPTPERIETRQLPDQTIDGHRCAVSERTISYGELKEVTVTFYAKDLSLALRLEVARPGGPKLITERRDVKTAVPAAEFEVPGDFKRVEKLPQE